MHQLNQCASINHISSSFAPSTHTVIGMSLLLYCLHFLSVHLWLPPLMLFCVLAKIIVIYLLCSHIIHEHTVTAFELSYHLKWNLAFDKNAVSVFLRPTYMVNSHSALLCKERRIQECSLFSLFYMQQTCKLITINEALLPGSVA